ncbi:putative kinesin [Ilyonectria robusta]
MPKEFDPVRALFDDGASCTYHGPPEDNNVYVVGRFAQHHTVLMMPGGKGELDAGMCTQRLRDRFQMIELTLLVGICGAMPQNFEVEESIYLGDVIVGTRVWRYLHDARSSQLQSGGVDLELRNLVAESASQRVKQLGNLLKTEDFREEIIELSFNYLTLLRGRKEVDKYKYPGHMSGFTPDKLFKSNYLHLHRSSDLQCSCDDPTKRSCDTAKHTSCKDLGCGEDGIERERAQTEEPPKPNLHVGTIASADVVMRAVSEFDSIFKKHNVLGVDMEGGGVRKATDCIVIKGAVDYADTHKNKDFAHYAAAAAASVAKAFLMNLYRGTTKFSRNASAQNQKWFCAKMHDSGEEDGSWITNTLTYARWTSTRMEDLTALRVLECRTTQRLIASQTLLQCLLREKQSVLFVDCYALPEAPKISCLKSSRKLSGGVDRCIWPLIVQAHSIQFGSSEFGCFVLDNIQLKDREGDRIPPSHAAFKLFRKALKSDKTQEKVILISSIDLLGQNSVKELAELLSRLLSEDLGVLRLVFLQTCSEGEEVHRISSNIITEDTESSGE